MNTREYYVKRRKQRRRRIVFRRIIFFLIIVLLIAALILGVTTALRVIRGGKAGEGFIPTSFYASKRIKKAESLVLPDWIDSQIISVHSTARTGAELTDIKNIVVHYVGNPGSTAQNNRDYFDKPTTGVSSHFVVGLEGEIIQCIPLCERSAASNDRNKDTISIEVCHPNEDGKFTEDSYNSLVKLCTFLLKEFSLDENDIIRHYDVTGKECPKYFVDRPEAFDTFKNDVKESLND